MNTSNRLIWPAFILMAANVIYTIAFWNERTNPAYTLIPLALLTPLLALPSVAGAWSSCSNACKKLFLLGMFATAYLVILALTRSHLPLPSLEYTAFIGAALVIMTVVATSRIPQELWLEALVISAIAGTAISLIGIKFYDFEGFGLGHFNHITTCASAPIWAWGAYLVAKCLNKEKVHIRQWVLLILGLVVLGLFTTYAVQGNIRRAPFVAGISACVFVCFFETIKRKRFILFGLTSAVIAIGIGMVIYRIGHDYTNPRYDRIALYLSAIDLIRDSLPWGLGAYGHTAAQDCVLPWAKERMLTGYYGLHAHNELLQACINGGILLLLAFLYAIKTILSKVYATPSSSLRLGFWALTGAIFANAMIDNALDYIVPLLWLGTMIGMILITTDTPEAMPTTTKNTWTSSKTAARSFRLAVWGLVLWAAFIATREFSGAFQSADASLPIRLRTIEQTWNAEVAMNETGLLLAECTVPQLLPLAQLAVETAGRKTNYLGTLAPASMEVNQAIAAAIHKDDEHAQMLKKLWSAQEINHKALAATIFLHDRMSTLIVPYDRLQTLLSNAPELVSEVPKSLLVQTQYATGRKDLPPPTFSTRLTSIDQATDAFIALSWALRTKHQSRNMHRFLADAVIRFGNIPSFAELFISITGYDEHAHEFLGSDTDRLCMGLHDSLIHFPEKLPPPRTESRKAFMAPLLAKAFPDNYRAFRENRSLGISTTQERLNKELALHLKLMSYWSHTPVTTPPPQNQPAQTGTTP